MNFWDTTLSENDLKRAEKALQYALLAPTILHPGWMDAPEHLIRKAKIHRLLYAPVIVEEERADDLDALLYLQSASLSVPFDSHWTRIYLHLFKKYYGHIAPPEILEDAPDELDNYEKTLLDDLKHWIFKQQMKAIEEKLKKNRKSKSSTKKTKNEATTQTTLLQFS